MGTTVGIEKPLARFLPALEVGIEVDAVAGQIEIRIGVLDDVSAGVFGIEFEGAPKSRSRCEVGRRWCHFQALGKPRGGALCILFSPENEGAAAVPNSESQIRECDCQGGQVEPELFIQNIKNILSGLQPIYRVPQKCLSWVLRFEPQCSAIGRLAVYRQAVQLAAQ